MIYASDLHIRSRYPVPDASDPLPCSSAVALGTLRHLLAIEETAEPGRYAGTLRLLSAAPRPWLRDGARIRVGGLPTHGGPVSFEVRSLASAGRIEAEVAPPRRDPFGAIRLRLRHPEAKPLRSVSVDGKAWNRFDRAREWIELPGSGGPFHVVAEY